MTVQFKAVRIVRLDAPVYDLPLGTILCVDHDDNYFRFAGLEPSLLPSAWPAARRSGITLYRDYWRHVAPSPDSPYGAALRVAPATTIKAVKPQ